MKAPLVSQVFAVANNGVSLTAIIAAPQHNDVARVWGHLVHNSNRPMTCIVGARATAREGVCCGAERCGPVSAAAAAAACA